MKFAKGLILFLLSLVMGAILFPPAFLFGAFLCWYRINIWVGFRNLGERFELLAKAFDKYGGVVCKELFDYTLIKRHETRYFFGNISQTISMVLGFNQRDGTLTDTGKWVVGVLDFFDPGHCLRAIETDKME